jgi:hypothetical protein
VPPLIEGIRGPSNTPSNKLEKRQHSKGPVGNKTKWTWTR